MNQGNKFYKTYDVKKISECHQSIGPKTLTPNSRLDRWSGVHNAISDWMINDADDEVAVLHLAVVAWVGGSTECPGH